MKKDLQNLARKNGLSAKVKAGRVAIMLKLYQDDPRARIWLRFEAARLAKSVSYHLRQASILGGVINQMEHGDRPALNQPNKRAPLPGASTEP